MNDRDNPFTNAARGRTLDGLNNDELSVHAYDSDDVVYEELRRLQSLCDGYRKIAHDATRLYFEVGIEYDKLKAEYVKLQQELHTSQNPQHPAY